MTHPIRYTPSDTVPAPMLTPGTRAIHKSASVTATPGVIVSTMTAEARVSQKRGAAKAKARAELNRKASR